MSVPAALTYRYTDKAEIDDLLSVNGVVLRADDRDRGTLSASELVRINTNAVNYATGKCNLYLLEKYEASILVDSWIVHHWATVIAARWLCKRRGNSVPESLEDEYEEILEELQKVKDGELSLGDVPQRESDQPTFSNVTLDNRYRVKQVRVQRPISEQSPSVFPQQRHYPSDYAVEP